MIVLAVDPGFTRSAWVIYSTIDGIPYTFGLEDNLKVRKIITGAHADVLVIESVASYGMPVGAEVFETCRWEARFECDWERSHSGPVVFLYRRQVKLHLCGVASAKDSNIRQALIDRFGPGREKAVGRKADPGPLYGFKADLWAALGVAVTWADQNQGGKS